MRFEIKRAGNGRYYWFLFDDDNLFVCSSQRDYKEPELAYQACEELISTMRNPSEEIKIRVT
jgi:hypothetical protein